MEKGFASPQAAVSIPQVFYGFSFYTVTKQSKVRGKQNKKKEHH